MSHVTGMRRKKTIDDCFDMFCFVSFDSLCYPGVQPDDYLYFGINRVIGGTYRPGTGVCHANVNWIQCKKIGRGSID